MTSSTVFKVSVVPTCHSVFAVIGRVVSAMVIAALNCAASTPPSASPMSHPPYVTSNKAAEMKARNITVSALLNER